MADEMRKRILANWLQVQADVADACKSADRDVDDVTIVGVTKYVDAATTAMLVDAGCPTLGENRPQVLWQKAESEEFASLDVNWHMIGHVQRNKLRRMLRYRPMIHSVDSPRLLDAIADEANSLIEPIRVLLEVNISGEEAKTGMDAETLTQLLLREPMPGVQICGLMAMAGWGTDASEAQRQFAKVRKLRDELSAKSGLGLNELSMGMSGDFVAAIAEGATMVRIGSRLFDGVI